MRSIFVHHATLRDLVSDVNWSAPSLDQPQSFVVVYVFSGIYCMSILRDAVHTCQEFRSDSPACAKSKSIFRKFQETTPF